MHQKLHFQLPYISYKTEYTQLVQRIDTDGSFIYHTVLRKPLTFSIFIMDPKSKNQIEIILMLPSHVGHFERKH